MAKKLVAESAYWRFHRRFLTNIIKATAMTKLSALTHFLAEFLRWFQKVAHSPPTPPYKLKSH